MYSKKILLLFVQLLLLKIAVAQNYQAINGSVYAGSLSAGNNPAAIVYVPYAWDITPFAIQLKQSTNIFTVGKYSFLSSPANIEVSANNGVKKRFLFANQDLRLLNARFNLNSRSAIAFGVNIRNYMHATSSESNYQDSSFSLADFQSINLIRLPLSFEAAGSTWAEMYASYSRTIMEDEYHILNAGITLKLNKSLAGAYARSDGIRYIPDIQQDKIGYALTNGNLQYGYSSNFDLIDSNQSAAANSKAFLKDTYSTLGADIGLEYIIFSPNSDDYEETDVFSYDTKIGISLMDIGSNRFRYSSRSRLAIAGKQGITDTLLENRFRDVRSIDDFNDSLATIAGSIASINGDFTIYKPTRLVINIDKHLKNNFFLNVELTVPVISVISKNALYLKDMNLLAITPRLETRQFGAYLPVLVNMRKQLWVGGAFRAGPLLLGTHNLANIFAKNKIQNGGLYLALTIRPGKKHDGQKDEGGRLTRKERQRLKCPAF